MRGIERRSIVLGAGIAGAGLACDRSKGGGAPRPGGACGACDTEPPSGGETTADIETRPFGSTGVRVSALGLGGSHLGVPDESTSVRMMHRAIDAGITFFDNCWSYHDGESERRMGKALAGGKREKVFLMTKIDARTYEAAKLQVDQCLERLATDRIDLMQLHEVIRETDAPWVFRDDGTMRALREAQKAGKIRFIGFTGHKAPRFHLQMLREAEEHDFRIDAAQLPLNVLDPHFESFEKGVLPHLVQKKMGVIGMKPLGSGDILSTGVVTAPECLRYALSLPTSVVITGCKSEADLDQAIEAGRTFSPLSSEEREELLARTASFGKEGELEQFKTTERFDGTARNPHWMTSAKL